MLTHVDEQIGRMVEVLKRTGQYENTPFKYFKQIVHNDGIADALIVTWPKGIRARGEIRNHYSHITDIAPTILDVTGVPFLEEIDGHEQMEMDGISLRYAFDNEAAPEKHSEQYYELFGNRAIYRDGWKAVTIHGNRMPWNTNSVSPFEDDVWELYNVSEDYSESHNLADQYPEKLEELKTRWKELARENNVFPLYDDMIQRLAKPQNRLFGDREGRRSDSGLRRIYRRLYPFHREQQALLRLQLLPRVV